MPTKLNKAGKPQEYIPKGYGDPSGEYGTNSGKGNKNIVLEPKGKGKPNVIDNNDGNLTGKTPPQENKPQKPQEQKPNVINEDNTAKGVEKKKKREKLKIDKKYKTKKEQQQAIDRGITDYVRPPFSGTINFDGMDPNKLEEVVDGIADVYDDFSNIFEKIGRIGTPMKKAEKETLFDSQEYEEYAKERRYYGISEEYIRKSYLKRKARNITTGNTLGACYTNNKEIQLKTDLQSDKLGNNNWTADNSNKSVMTHELGHAIYNDVLGDLKNKKGNEDIRSFERTAKLQELDKRLTEAYQESKGNISRYGSTNRDEAVAESVSSHYAGQNNPYAEKIFNILKEAYNLKYGG